MSIVANFGRIINCLIPAYLTPYKVETKKNRKKCEILQINFGLTAAVLYLVPHYGIFVRWQRAKKYGKCCNLIGHNI